MDEEWGTGGDTPSTVDDDGKYRQRTPRLTAMQRDQGRLLAGLLDVELDRRRVRHLSEWAPELLDMTAPVRCFNTTGLGLQLDLLALHLAGLLESAVEVTGPGDDPEPGFRIVSLGSESVEVPSSVRAAIPATEQQPFPFAIELRPMPQGALLTLVVSRRHEREGLALLSSMEHAAEANHHPYRGRTLRLSAGEEGLDALVVPNLTDQRDDLVLPREVWASLERDVHAPLRHAEQLTRRGLGAGRGVLLHGPPGTGKTAVCRVLAAEVAGAATVLLPTAAAVSQHLEDVFELARTLAPTLLVLEDVDLVAGRRTGRLERTLATFLANLDGLLSADDAIVTLASTNDADALDQAATRSNRIDRILEVPLPNLEARRRIWARYLADDAVDVDLTHLAALTGGSTGADIRELIRTATLDGTPATTVDLASLIASSRVASAATGQYL